MVVWAPGSCRRWLWAGATLLGGLLTGPLSAQEAPPEPPPVPAVDASRFLDELPQVSPPPPGAPPPADPLPPEDPAKPAPAWVGGVAIELGSLSTTRGDFDIVPRLALSQRLLFKVPLILGADAALAPLTGTPSHAQLTLGPMLSRPFVHLHGQVAAAETRYSDAWSLGGGPRQVEDPVHAYEVLEGGEPVGWTTDLRGVGLVAGPRLVIDPTVEDAPVAVAAYVGVQGLYQQAPGWVGRPAAVGDPVRPVSAWLFDAGALWLRGEWWAEVSMAGTGGPRIVGFTRRRLYGRVGARVHKDAVEIWVGIGSGTQRNRGMEVLPLSPAEEGLR